MPAPFYDAIKGTTSGTPGTGAFTPNAASAGFRAWSVVPAGWIGLVRFEDGSAWSLEFCYWNGTTLSRASTQRFDSSTGSHLTLTSAATAAMVISSVEVASHLGGVPWRYWMATVSSATPSSAGMNAPTATGTASSAAIASTNLLLEQPRSRVTSATTANAQAGWSQSTKVVITSSTAGRGGWEFTSRFGASGLPTGPRLFIGLSDTTIIANTGEPSALTAHYAIFGKDSADTNIQLMTNSNAGSGTKVDTGIAFAANGLYEATLWSEQGSLTVYGLLVRLDTGEIWFGSTSTDVPATGISLAPYLVGGLSATTGTAFVLEAGSVFIRSGA